MDDCVPIELLEYYSSSNFSYADYSFGGDDSGTGHDHNASLDDEYDTPDVTSIDHMVRMELIEAILYKYVAVFISVLGILGNILNLVILTRKSLTKSMDRMEKSAHCGLMALAVSDLLFCLAVLPHAWVDTKVFYFDSFGFDLIYSLYGNGVINICLMASTWLTVTIATSRYLAIVHPLRARERLGMTFARASILVVFVASVVFNLPRFWSETFATMECIGNYSVYYRDTGLLDKYPQIQAVYTWLYFIVCVLVPFLWLTYCNAYLMRALKESLRMRTQYQRNSRAVAESTHRVTLTLVVIVIMYLLLVIPSEVLTFLRDDVISSRHITPSYNLAVAILNIFQSLNFSFNFILYCAVNVHFRDTLATVFCRKRARVDRFITTSSGWYQSVSATTTV